MSPALAALLPLVLETDRRISASVSVEALNALSELARIGGLEVTSSLPIIFKSLVDYVQDSRSQARREVSHICLGRTLMSNDSSGCSACVMRTL